MASRREDVLKAVETLIKIALPGAEVKRNAASPANPPPGGLVIIRDGEPGEPDITLSPLTYTYEHAIPVEVVANPASADRRWVYLDSMLPPIGAAIEANRTLGGLTDWLEPTTPDTTDAVVANTPPWRVARFEIIAVYSTTNPLF